MPKRYLLLAATFLLSVLLYVDRVCISVAKEGITTDLGLSKEQFGWALSAFTLGYALCQTPAGLMADRFGPRRLLAGVVVLWSLFTGLTGMVRGLWSLLVVRTLFGAGEAGAFPGMARAVYSWMPMGERGIAQGINFSGSRLGAAFALPLVATLIDRLGWRMAFGVLMGASLVWPLVWYWWFRDDPQDFNTLSDAEREHILQNRQPQRAQSEVAPLTSSALFGSRNMWYTMIQYLCSNYTFFFCLGWWFPYLKETYDLNSEQAGWLASVPFLFGAVGNIVSGWSVDRLYRSGHHRWSRKLPAIIGFALATIGMLMSLNQATATGAVLWLSVAIFGADMTLSPSWSHCVDIGGPHSGAVSGTMNMAGNFGSFSAGIAFPYLESLTGTTDTFFYVAAALNLLAIVMWWRMNSEDRIA